MGATRSADSPAARALAIGSALESLFAARHDDATARFDAELAAAVEDGRLDDETARTLRWWQRASVQGAQNYVTDLLPGVLHADDAAQRRSRAQVDFAAASWREATDAAAQIGAARLEAGPEPVPNTGPDGAPAPDPDEDDLIDSASAAAHPAARLRVRLVSVPRHAARAHPASPTASPTGKDTSGNDNSATTA